MNRLALTPYRALLAALLLGLAGLLLNRFLPIDIYYRLSFLLGSTFAIMALELLGARAAVLVGLIAASGTLLLWNQPFPFVILSAEIVVIALLYRYMQNLMAAVCVYWLLIGAPALLGIFHLVMGVEAAASLVYALKFAVNGVFNTLLASLVLLAIRFVRFRRNNDPCLRIPFADALALLLTAVVFIPTLAATIISMRIELAEQERQLSQLSRQVSEASQLRLQPWFNSADRDLGELEKQISFIASRRGGELTIVDQGGTVVASTTSRPKLATGRGLTVTHPPKMVGVPWLEIMQQASLVNRQPLGKDAGWEVIVEIGYAPIVKELNQRAVALLGLLFSLMLSVVLLAQVIGNRFSRTILCLEQVTASLPLRINREELPDWPDSILLEVGELTDNSRKMAESLAAAFRELHTINESLEQRVAERTRECAEARDVAELASQAKGRFLAVMSHEIRTPMNAIMGITTLLRETPLNHRQRELLDYANDASSALLQIINDVLDFSRVEANRLVIRPEPFSLKDLLEALRSLFGVTARRKQLALDLHLPEGLPDLLLADRGRLRQVLSNLLSNALKFTENGRIALEVEQLPPPGDRQELWLRFTVSDTGIGIEPAKQAIIFDMFSQADDSTTRRFGGTGLGLAICRQLVELMGGTMGVNSTPGQGSQFFFELPFGRAVSLPAQASIASASLALPRLRILLAEDNPVNQMVSREFLTSLGQEVVTVSDGCELLDLLAAQEFDLVMTDISMPEMDGLQAVAIIRSGERPEIDPDIPVIAMTAHALTEDRDRFLLAGMDGYVPKPVAIEQLVHELRRLLPERFGAAGQEMPPANMAQPRETAMTETTLTTADDPLDRDYLDRNYLALGCADVLVDVVAMYLESAPEKLAALHEALAAGHCAELVKVAHGLKGESGSVGARHVVALAAAVEQSARQGDLAACRDSIPELERELERVTNMLKQEYGE